MPRITIRLVLLAVIASLMLGAITGCFGGGDSEEEPTPDAEATIEAARRAAAPPDTPTPEPTDAPPATEAPTPNIEATVAAAIAALQPTTEAPPPAVEATIPPAEVAATSTPLPVPTNTPVPTATPVPEQSGGPPCIIAGTVRVSGAYPAEGTKVYARSQTADKIVETETDGAGRYVLTITDFDMVFDLFVEGNDTGLDTPTTSRGCREIRNLRVG